MSARRLYLGRSTSPPTSSNAATIDAYWTDVVNEAAVDNSSTPPTAPAGGAMVGESGGFNSANAGQSVIGQFVWRFITAPLAAGRLPGNLSLVVRSGHTTNHPTKLAVVVNLYNADGSIKRGNLFLGTSVNNVGGSTSTTTSITVTGALTPLEVTAGDRLHIEIGFITTRDTTTGSGSGLIRLGDPTALDDLAFGEGSTIDGRPWVEFSIDPYTTRPKPAAPVIIGVTQVPGSETTALQVFWEADPGRSHTITVIGPDGLAHTGLEDPGATSHLIPGLDPGTTYEVKVFAEDIFGTSVPATEYGTTAASFLPAPTGLAVVATDTTLTLSWDAVPGADGYRGRIDFGPVIEFGTDLAHVFAYLPPSTPHDMEVWAYQLGVDGLRASISEATRPTPGHVDYTVGVRIGTPGDYIEWTAPSGYMPTDPAESFLADPAEWSWSFPDGLWPSQPSPVQVRLSIVTPTALDPDRVDIGHPLQAIMELTAPTTGRCAAGWGRITDLDVVPVRYVIEPDGGPRTVVDGLRYDITAVDYTAEWGEYSSGDTALGQQSGAARLSALVSQAPEFDGIPPMPSSFGGNHGTLPLNPRPVSPSNLLSVLLEVLAQVPSDTGKAGVLSPRLDQSGGTHELSAVGPMAVDYLPDWIDVDAGVWEVPAAVVDRDARWRRSKVTAPNRVRLTGQPNGDAAAVPRTRHFDAPTRPTDVPPVVQSLSTELAFTADWHLMADLYLSDIPSPADRWMVDEFTLFGEWAPEALVPMWFPDHQRTGDDISPDPRSLCYVRPVKVTGIDPVTDPTSRGYFAGQLAGVTFTLADGRPTVRFRLRRAIELS